MRIDQFAALKKWSIAEEMVLYVVFCLHYRKWNAWVTEAAFSFDTCAEGEASASWYLASCALGSNISLSFLRVLSLDPTWYHLKIPKVLKYEEKESVVTSGRSLVSAAAWEYIT
jgi:hypothetical protein